MVSALVAWSAFIEDPTNFRADNLARILGLEINFTIKIQGS